VKTFPRVSMTPRFPHKQQWPLSETNSASQNSVIRFLLAMPYLPFLKLSLLAISGASALIWVAVVMDRL